MEFWLWGLEKSWKLFIQVEAKTTLPMFFELLGLRSYYYLLGFSIHILQSSFCCDILLVSCWITYVYFLLLFYLNPPQFFFTGHFPQYLTTLISFSTCQNLVNVPLTSSSYIYFNVFLSLSFPHFWIQKHFFLHRF